VTKLAAESYAEAFAEVYDLPVLPFRFFNVFGPRQRAGHVYAAVIPVFMDAALRGDRLPVNGDGTFSRDFTYVGTVTRILGDAVEQRVSAGATNLAFGTRTTLLDLVDTLGVVMHTQLEVEFRDPRPGDVPHSQADDRQLRSLFPDIVPVPLAQGLAETHEWMRAHVERARGADA
jgi:UDP-glucose 4-epimerase